MFAVLVLCLVAIAAAQRPQPCIAPKQFEGRIFDTNEQQKFGLQGRLSYDADNQRERLVDQVEEGTEVDRFDVIALFDLKVEFVYNFRLHNCSRREITRPWRDFGIRSNDTSYGEAYIGTSAFPGGGVLATIWGGNFTTPQNDTVTFISSWAFLGCIPIQRTTFNPRMGISHLSFYDVTLGIADPSVFIPRRECLSDEEWENRYTLFGTPAKKHI